MKKNFLKSPVELTVKDRKILCELDMGARQPLSAIAKKVGLSREVVDYRIKQLERTNIIRGYYAVLDTSRLGLMYCRIFFKYRKMPAEKEKELLVFCQEHPNVAWIILGEGKWDIVLVVLARTLAEIELLYDELTNRFSVYLQNPYVSLAFQIYEFMHKYLYQTQEKREIMLGNNQEIALDAAERALLAILAQQAKMPLVELARKLSLSSKVVSYRIKKLVAEGVILAFRARINTSLLGYDYYKVFLTLQNFDAANRLRILGFLRHHPQVIYVTKPMGTATLEFEAMVKNTNELHKLMQQFKQQFGDLLIDYETYFTYDVRTVRYLSKTMATWGHEDKKGATDAKDHTV